jgi:hypothetical protein
VRKNNLKRERQTFAGDGRRRENHMLLVYRAVREAEKSIKAYGSI